MAEKEYIERDKIGLTDFEIIMCKGNYKEALKILFDKIESMPAANVQPVVTCSECIYAPSGDGQGFDLEWPHDEWPESNPCPWKCEDGWYSHKPRPNFFCANGKGEK